MRLVDKLTTFGQLTLENFVSHRLLSSKKAPLEAIPVIIDNLKANNVDLGLKWGDKVTSCPRSIVNAALMLASLEAKKPEYLVFQDS